MLQHCMRSDKVCFYRDPPPQQNGRGCCYRLLNYVMLLHKQLIILTPSCISNFALLLCNTLIINCSLLQQLSSPLQAPKLSSWKEPLCLETSTAFTSVVVMLSDASSPTVQVEDTGGGSLSKGTRSLGVHTSTLEGNISSGSSARAHKQQPCKYFLSKRDCPFGERCRYLHAELGVDPEGGGKRQVCRYFLSSGTCRYGNKCKYLHPTPPHKPRPTGPQATPPSPPDVSSSAHPPPLLDVSSFPSMKGKHVPHLHCEYLLYIVL